MHYDMHILPRNAPFIVFKKPTILKLEHESDGSGGWEKFPTHLIWRLNSNDQFPAVRIKIPAKRDLNRKCMQTEAKWNRPFSLHG